MNIQVGQIYEDRDKRRAGRTFKISNIDDNIATCENLTGAGGKAPDKNRLISFIKLDRFKTNKYYKLVKKSIKKEDDEKKEVIDRIINGAKDSIKYVVKRPKQRSLAEKCSDHWFGKWKTVGPMAVLESDRLEVNLRQTCKFPQTYDIKIKLDKFCIYNKVINDKLENILTFGQKEILNLNSDINSLLFGELYG